MKPPGRGSNVRSLGPKTDPATVACLTVLLAQARAGNLRGIAYVALVRGRKCIVDYCGEAHTNPVLTRGLLPQLEKKLDAGIEPGTY